jgi:3-oxoacyl-[acyl-carrier protein] reductase
MGDGYQALAGTPAGRFVVKKLGLPRPTRLERYHAGDQLVTGTVLVGGTPSGRLAEPIRTALHSLGISSVDSAQPERPRGLVFDATGITSSPDLRTTREFFAPVLRSLSVCGRVVVLGTPPGHGQPAAEHLSQRALEGFTRSLAKEVGNGSTVQLVYVSSGHEHEIASTLAFLLSPKSAYVSGQVIRIGGTGTPAPARVSDWTVPLVDTIALVTGAARGIGTAIARVLARDGATVIGVDVPAAGRALRELMSDLGGHALPLDISVIDAPQRIAHYIREHHDGIDIVVHNAGITRDKRLANMQEAAWRSTIAVNLTAAERITTEVLTQDLVRGNGRIICVSSIAGIAGNVGQTSYATSKAGLIGLVEAFSPRYAGRGITVNAVAPGFIETQMTRQIPLLVREAGRRMNSLAQGGQPVDVAEAIAWFANPASTAVNGNVLRVCGQSLLGA